MATLQAIGFNALTGAIIGAVTLTAFGAAVRWGSASVHSQLAPRVWSRPRNMLKSILPRPYGISWIPWALKLSYQELLDGIPGTGTRMKGKMGPLLKCTLDDIVLIKFHSLCWKVAMFSTALCLCIILPLNYTAECDSTIVGDLECEYLKNLTNFEQTTLAHIPSLKGTADTSVTNSTIIDVNARLFGIVIVAWIIYIFTCALLWREWIDNLALRRVFYLEHDHWKERRDELDYVLKGLKDVDEDPYQERRPPWLPHPEVRETVPNVSLYSVLFKFPNAIDESQRKPHQSELEWQLEYASKFFDECVPNMPGFSSSVAAVTIIPDAMHLATAWKKWKRLAKKVRRLRFIRHVKRNKQRERWMRSHSMRSSGIRGVGVSMRNELSDPDIPEKSVEGDNVEDDHPDAPPSPIGNQSEAAMSIFEDRPKGHRYQLSEEDIDHVLSSPETYESSAIGEGNSTEAQKPMPPSGDTPSARSILNESFPNAKASLDTTATPVAHSTEEPNRPGSPSSLVSIPEKAPLPVGEESSKPTAMERSSDKEHMTTPISESSSSEGLKMFQTPDQKRASPTVPLTIDTKQDYSIDDSKEGLDTFNISSIERPNNSQSNRFSYLDFDQTEYSRQVGLHEESELPSFMMGFGVEQTAVYVREFARSSAPCCPFGCNEDGVMNATLEELEDMEAEAIEDVQHANVELQAIKSVVNRTNMDIDSKQFFNEDDDTTTDPEDHIRVGEPSLSDDPRGTNHHTRSRTVSFGSNNEYDPENQSIRGTPRSIRRRKLTTDSSKLWEKVNSIVMLTASTPKAKNRSAPATTRKIGDGKWRRPTISSLRNLFLCGRNKLLQQSSHMQEKIKHAAHVSGELAKQVTSTQSYAVVTLTSRQAAIAARQCLSDGSGLNSWREVEDIPIPPLADAAPCTLCDCRGCCRPVTFTIQDWQKIARLYFARVFFVAFCFLYTIPLTAASNLLAPQNLAENTEVLKRIRDNEVFTNLLSGLITGLLYTTFFSVLPHIFRFLANFGSNATNIREAEYFALRYYFFFMLATAFTGTSLSNILLNGLNSGLNLGQEAQEVLREVALVIPTQVSATWINWIVVRLTTTFPLFYLFQFNTFLFSCMGIKCCARLLRGGGPGGPLPYRIYVDTGVVFLCVIALAPASPIVSVVASIYFLVFTPMIRWLLIFVYRPDHDGGGRRWPLLFEMLISAMVLGQVFLTTMMALKRAVGPAVLAGLSIVPTMLFREYANQTFARSYRDCGLLQTASLDGWDRSRPSTMESREEYRRWLVDCHRASFVPICVAGNDSCITLEPAVVVPDGNDRDHSSGTLSESHRSRLHTATSRSSINSNQRGATFRRMSMQMQRQVPHQNSLSMNDL